MRNIIGSREDKVCFILVLIVLVLAFASESFGQDLPVFVNVTLTSEDVSLTPQTRVPPEVLAKFRNYQKELLDEVKRSQQVREKWFWAAQGAIVVSSYFDIDSTMDALERCRKQNLNCTEANPILKPFVGDRQTAYLAMAGLDALQIYLNYRTYKEGPTQTKWWVAASILSIGSHAFGYSINIKVGY